ncbi:hypothetical protein KI387_017480 [Taxus chinensis]|uniref:NPF family transporter n=1 Tax=Taxus chinensis TaxID=29808 RepID=A0AA38GGW2_TAXCH|nr:hypothetical protein KI387_017480 [Taxus chinensis]
MLFTGLYLVAIGNGGIKATLLPFGADQLYAKDPIQRRKISSYFNMFVLSLNIGEGIAVTVVVWVQNNKGWDAGFGISAGAIFLANICIVAGLTTYRNRTSGSSPLTRIMQVFVAAFHNRKLSTPENVDDLYELHDKEAVLHTEKLLHTNQFKFLDKAAIIKEKSSLDENNKEISPWQLCSVNQVEEIKVLARMMPIFASTIMINTCLAQLQTFSVSQGVTMDRSMGKNFEIPAASLPIIAILLVIIFTPLYDKFFVPLARRFTGHETGITHLQRIGVGLFLSSISMGIAAVVEVKRNNVAKDNGMVDAIPLLMPPLPISVFWLLFQYVVFGMAEMFTFAGLMEFFHSEAPAGMTSMATAFSWTSLSMGYFLSSVLVDIVNAATRNITKSNGWLAGNNLNRNHLNLFYWLLSILNMLNFLNYLLWSRWYKYKYSPLTVGRQVTYDQASGVHLTTGLQKST